jgi:hypothetical protein
VLFRIVELRFSYLLSILLPSGPLIYPWHFTPRDRELKIHTLIELFLSPFAAAAGRAQPGKIRLARAHAAQTR